MNYKLEQILSSALNLRDFQQVCPTLHQIWLPLSPPLYSPVHYLLLKDSEAKKKKSL